MLSDEIQQISSSLATEIPIEIVSDEEMSLIEAAFSVAFETKRNYNNISNCLGDIEDGVRKNNNKKKMKNTNLLQRFRKKTGLFVTDITSSVWFYYSFWIIVIVISLFKSFKISLESEWVESVQCRRLGVTISDTQSLVEIYPVVMGRPVETALKLKEKDRKFYRTQ